MPKKTKKITLEDLAIMTKRGFDGMGERFDRLEGRMDKLEGRMDNLENRVGSLEATLKTQYPDKNFLSDKLADLAAEIGARIERKKDLDRKFKEKVLEILKRHSLAEKDEILFLEKLLSS